MANSDSSDSEYVNVCLLPNEVEAKVVNDLITADLSNYDVIPQFPSFANNVQVIRMSTSQLEIIEGDKSTIPNQFCEMKCLKQLFLFGDAIGEGAGLSSLPKDFGRLKTLEVLNLEHNPFKEFPEQLCELNKLKKLYLNGCRLTYISPCIVNLYNLLEADLSDNDFSTGLCKELFELPRLKDLYLMNCKLSSLPSEIGNLQVLEGLRLSDNHLTEFPDELYTLRYLKKLSATKNNISKLSSKIIGLESLKVLLLGENKLTVLPNEIGKLPLLEVVDVHGNKLTCLPDTVKDLDSSSKLFVHSNCYLHRPPLSICMKGIDSIKGFFTSMAKNDKIHSNRIKIVMLGEEGAGKTFLTHALVNCKACESKTNDSTIGVEMHPCTFQEDGVDDGLEACIVDCAGQRRYQLTHPFFLSEDGLHIIVVNLKTYQKDQESFKKYLEDWINWITARLWEPRIMIVGTHRDELTDDEVSSKCNDIIKRIEDHEKLAIERLEREIKSAIKAKKSSIQHDRDDRSKEENLKWLKKHRPYISSKVLLEKGCEAEQVKESGCSLNLVAVSSTDVLKGVILLRNEICRVAKCKKSSACSEVNALFPQVGKDLPKPWETLECAIKKYRNDRKQFEVHCMTMDQFVSFANEKAELQGPEVQSVLHYLDSVGEIKFYENIPSDQYCVFLDLPWLCKLVKLLFRHDYEEEDAIEFKDEYNDFEMEKVKFENHLSQLKESGILSLPLLKCFWKELQLSKDDFHHMIRTLVTFGLASEIPNKKEEMFIPWFLHSELNPEKKKEIFPDFPSDDQEELRLKFCIVGYLPAGVFDRLCVRCYAHSIELACTWKNSMLIYKNDTQIYLQVVESEITVIGRTTSENKQIWSEVLEVVKELRTLLSEWPRIVYHTYTVCPHCIKRKSSKPYHFECKWWTGEKPTSTTCRNTVKRTKVDVNRLVPPEELPARPPQAVIPVPVSSYQARLLAEKIPKHWKPLGTHLGLENELIDAIEENHRDVKEQAYNMLTKWLEIKASEANTLSLIDGLQKTGRNDLVVFVHSWSN